MNERPSHPNADLDALIARLWCGRLDEQFSGMAALAVGGSTSRGLADENSDLDLFALVDDLSAGEHVAEEFFDWIGTTTLTRGPTRVDNIGVMFGAVLPGLSSVQLTLNTPATFGQHPMRRSSVVIFDRRHQLQKLLDGLDEPTDDRHEDLIHDVSLMFWHRALQGSHAIEDGQLWRSLGYLADLQRLMLQLTRLRNGRFAIHGSPHFPATRAEHDLGADLAATLYQASARYDVAEARNAFAFACEWFFGVGLTSAENWSRDDIATMRSIATLLRSRAGV